MRLRIIIPFVITVMMTIGCIAAAASGTNHSYITASSSAVIAGDESKLLERMNESAAALYEAVYADNRQAAFLYLQRLQRQLDAMADNGWSNEPKWHSLREDTEAIAYSLAKGKPLAEWINAVARLKLTMDAAVLKERALWVNYEKVMQDDFDRLNKAWSRQTIDRSSAALAAMKSLEEHAERIKPAAASVVGERSAAELMERIRHTKSLLAANEQGISNASQIDKSLGALAATIEMLFKTVKQNELPAAALPVAAGNPLSWSFFLGAVISAVLTYTGWRKYKHTPYGVKPLT